MSVPSGSLADDARAVDDRACITRSDVGFRAALAGVPWSRVALGWLLAFTIGTAIAFTMRQAGWWEGAAWERAMLVRVNDTVGPTLDVVMLTLPFIGTNYTLAPMIAIAAFLLWRRGYTTVGVHLIVVQAGSWTLNPALKFAMPRERPDLFEARGQHAFPAYPSGHMIAVVAVVGTAAYLLYRCGRGRWVYWLFGVFFLLVAYSRLYLGVHWPMDVVGGTVVGAVWLWWTLKTLRPLHRTTSAGVVRPAVPERRARG